MYEHVLIEHQAWYEARYRAAVVYPRAERQALLQADLSLPPSQRVTADRRAVTRRLGHGLARLLARLTHRAGTDVAAPDAVQP